MQYIFVFFSSNFLLTLNNLRFHFDYVLRNFNKNKSWNVKIMLFAVVVAVVVIIIFIGCMSI